MSKRALIAGGSLAGLMSGILLLRAGWDVAVFERGAGDLSGRGAGIVTHDGLWEVMAAAGIDVARKPGVRIRRRVVYAQDGSILAQRPVDEIVTSWDTLYRTLLTAFPPQLYRRGASVTTVETDTHGVVATLADGAHVDGDLLVGADGAASSVRGVLAPHAQSVYADYIIWRGLVDEADLPPVAARDLVDTFAFCTPPGEQILSYTVPGSRGETAPGMRRQNFAWYQPADARTSLPDLLTDTRGRVHRPNIPPPLIRPSVVAAMRARARTALSPAFAALALAVQQPFIQPIADHLSPCFAAGRIALVGDAAAQARPHVGAGATKALEDAAALARALATHERVEDAMAAYDAERREAARRMVELGRWLGRHLEPAHGSGGEDQAPATLLNITATGLHGPAPASTTGSA